MKKALFIINPIAGVKKKKDIPELIKIHLDSNIFDFQIVFTKYAGHGKILAEDATKTHDIVIAVGGDGTINEIATGLRHSDTNLGIIPMGSGNGLARHLNIPLNTVKAIQFLNLQKERKIDTCTLNDQTFFCTAGVGFDGYIGDIFAKQTSRGFWTYIKCTIREFFNYKPKNYFFNETQVKATLITVANANQFGNNVFISPFSNIEDGKFEVCVLKPFPKWSILGLSIQLFTKKINNSKYYNVSSHNEVIIENHSNEFVHLDGEPIGQIKKLHIKNFPKSLKVIA